MSLQFFTHYFLHLGAPFFLAIAFFRDDWKKAYFIMLATMLIDLDHLLATPVFQANRCSIGFHPLHTIYAAAVYVVLFFLKRPWRIIGIGLLFHLLTDTIDCMFMFGKCGTCHEGNPLFELLGS